MGREENPKLVKQTRLMLYFTEKEVGTYFASFEAIAKRPEITGALRVFPGRVLESRTSIPVAYLITLTFVMPIQQRRQHC